MLRMISVTSSLTPGIVENSCSTPSMRMLVTAAPGMRRQQRAAQGVAERVAEAGLEGLDDEAAAVVRDDLFAEGGALCDEHWCFLSVGDRYMTPMFSPVSSRRPVHLCPWPGRTQPVCRVRRSRTRHTDGVGQFLE